MSQKREEVHYRRMKIVARLATGKWQARAFDNTTPATEIHTAASKEEAVTSVKAELDKRAADERASRGSDGFPTSDHVLNALKRLRPHDGQMAMLEAHYRADNYTLTATQLARAAGKDSHSYANSQYGALARDLAEEMEFVPDNLNPDDGSTVWTFTLADGKRDAVDGEYVEWEWTLRPQVAEALRRMGFER